MKNSIWATVMILALTVFFPLSVSAESKDVTMKEGETETLYLPSSVTSKNLKSVNFYSNGISYVQVTSHTNYSVTVKAIKAFSSPIVVRCDYRYYVRNGSYTYETSGYYDFLVTVVGNGSGGSSVKPTSITFPTSAVGIDVGESRQLTPTVLPANAEYTLTWSINDKSVATISQDGLLVGKSAGSADLTVKADNGVYAMLRVVVSKVEPSSISVTPSTLTLTEEESRYLTASVYPSNASQTVTWTSSNSSVATVNDSGKVTAIKEGTATISAKTSNGKTASCSVTVRAKTVKPTSISLNESCSLMVGETKTIEPVILPSNAQTKLSWETSNPEVVDVENGLLKALKEGTSVVTVKTDNGIASNCLVTVISETTGLDSVRQDWTGSDEVIIYNLEGRVVYAGLYDNIPTLPSHIYIVKQGDKISKMLINKQ